MPDSYEEWYQKQVESGLLPDANGYYHYIHSETEEKNGFGMSNKVPK